MARLEEIGARDGWRCWLCDDSVDPGMSVNDARGPSIDSVVTRAKAKKADANIERLAHRGCNTKRGAVAPVVPWPPQLLVADPAPIMATVDRLQRMGGREVVGRCMTSADAAVASRWLLDRLSRLAPGLAISADVEPGGGQYLLVLSVR